MNANPVLIQKDDPAIVVLTLDRPEKRNALSLAMIEALRDSVLGASADPACRVLIVRANGPAFCAGLDLREASDPEMHQKSAEALAAMYEALGNSPLITIATAHGAAMGGGAGLLAACDFVIAADDLRITALTITLPCLPECFRRLANSPSCGLQRIAATDGM